MDDLTHDVTCTGCGTLFACTCVVGTDKHQRRKDRGWKDLCPSCNKADLEAWNAHLRTLPESRVAGESENLTDPWKDR